MVSFLKKYFIYTKRSPVDIPLPEESGFVTLLGDGPSLQYALDKPFQIRGPVAAVNKAGIK